MLLIQRINTNRSQLYIYILYTQLQQPPQAAAAAATITTTTPPLHSSNLIVDARFSVVPRSYYL